MYLAACGPTHVWPDLTIRMWSDWKTAVPPAGGSIISLYIFIQHMYITFYTPASLNKSVFELWAGPVPVMWNLGSIKYFKPYLIPDLYLKKKIYKNFLFNSCSCFSLDEKPDVVFCFIHTHRIPHLVFGNVVNQVWNW